jgi:hypothetical protein
MYHSLCLSFSAIEFGMSILVLKSLLPGDEAYLLSLDMAMVHSAVL